MIPFPSRRRSPKTPFRARLRVEELESRNLLAASGLGAVVVVPLPLSQSPAHALPAVSERAEGVTGQARGLGDQAGNGVGRNIAALPINQVSPVASGSSAGGNGSAAGTTTTLPSSSSDQSTAGTGSTGVLQTPGNAPNATNTVPTDITSALAPAAGTAQPTAVATPTSGFGAPAAVIDAPQSAAISADAVLNNNNPLLNNVNVTNTAVVANTVNNNLVDQPTVVVVGSSASVPTQQGSALPPINAATADNPQAAVALPFPRTASSQIVTVGGGEEGVPEDEFNNLAGNVPARPADAPPPAAPVAPAAPAAPAAKDVNPDPGPVVQPVGPLWEQAHDTLFAKDHLLALGGGEESVLAPVVAEDPRFMADQAIALAGLAVFLGGGYWWHDAAPSSEQDKRRGSLLASWEVWPRGR